MRHDFFTITRGFQMELRTKSLIGGIALAACVLLGCQPSQPTTQAAAKPGGSTQPSLPPEPPSPDARIGPSPPNGVETGAPARDTTPVEASVRDVTLSNHGDTEKNTLGIPVSRFGPNDSVYAEIRSEGTASEYTIYAKWIGADGVTLADYGIKLNIAGPSRTVISLSKPDGWPLGKNKIELAINGKAQRTVTFDVQ
jgi:hypothetical protein